jgi:hypothetical protein
MAPAFNRNNAFTSITLRLADYSPGRDQGVRR